jgi:hypothetical protein
VPNFATQIAAGPANESGQTFSFAVTRTDSGLLEFDVDPAIDANGQLTYTITPGTFGTAEFSVVLTDSGSGVTPNVNTSTPETFIITVTESGGGEGEAAGLANAAALDAFYASLNDGDAESDMFEAVSDDEWQDAVDAAMSQLG